MGDVGFTAASVPAQRRRRAGSAFAGHAGSTGGTLGWPYRNAGRSGRLSDSSGRPWRNSANWQIVTSLCVLGRGEPLTQPLSDYGPFNQSSAFRRWSFVTLLPRTDNAAAITVVSSVKPTAATVWEVKRSKRGVICNLETKRPHIHHYSFHILDREWGHITTKMAGHPSFGTQIILNGHEYVGCRARRDGIAFTKESPMTLRVTTKDENSLGRLT
jgi:hypothetical protein